MIKFRQKDFSFLGKVTTGTAIGTSIGTLVSKLGTKIPMKFKGKYTDISGNSLIGAGALFGAALGTLAGAIEAGSNYASKKTADRRLMSMVVDDLKKTGFKEGQDFTRDPKRANEIKTRVCLVVTRNSGDLRVLINTVSDPKLKELVDRTTKNIPNMSAMTRKASDKFNEITITTISDTSADVGLVAGLAEKFIRAKYPVYLIEVG